MEPEAYVQMQRIEDVHWWFVGRRQIVRDVLACTPPASPRRVLDVGCGTGGNLPMLAAFGEVTGVEMCEMARQAALARGIGRVLLGKFPEALPATGEKFQLVTFLDVLEHLDDDLAALQAAKQLLAPEGIVLVTVPAFMFLWNGHDEQHHHRRRYTARGLRAVLRRSGLEPVHVSYFNMWLFPLIAAIRLAKKLAGDRRADDESVPPAPLNGILQAIFSSERHMLRSHSLPFGVSLLAVARHAPPEQPSPRPGSS